MTEPEQSTIARVDAAMKAAGWDLSDPHGAAECLLTDLRHWCRARGVSFAHFLGKSRAKYREERKP